jgi:hypothetical protein
MERGQLYVPDYDFTTCMNNTKNIGCDTTILLKLQKRCMMLENMRNFAKLVEAQTNELKNVNK